MLTPAKKSHIFKHLSGLRVNAHFSFCARFRYLLTIDDPAVKTGKTICAIMQNPSIADEHVADKSVQFLEKLIFRKQTPVFGPIKCLHIVNQFAFIQTRNFKGCRQHIGDKNIEFIQEAITDADLILIAWGKNNPYMQQKQTILQLLLSKNPRTIYQTRRHPSRGAYTDFIFPYSLVEAQMPKALP